ncbi:MAG: hypothetical protein OEZ10_13185 [Gammaproteobacteria bacterium]|nr:hypothetical protein [Gammaproteobacteria bacterium]
MDTHKRLLVKQSVDDMREQMDALSQLFFRELFHLDISLKHVFAGNVVFLNRKFANMMNTLASLKYLEKIKPSLIKMAERHLLAYGAQAEHLELAKHALMLALRSRLEDKFTEELEAAWNGVLTEVTGIMTDAMERVDRREAKRDRQDDDAYDPDLLNKIGGADTVMKVHERFYDVMFDHPWLGRFFGGKNKPTLIRKQTEFMVAAFGGPNNYKGDTPAFVHMHMFITEEQADLRESILRQAILDQGLSTDIADSWMKMDQSFRRSIVKQSVDECIMKCKGQAPLVAPKPKDYDQSAA